jgi:hypothetical protein
MILLATPSSNSQESDGLYHLSSRFHDAFRVSSNSKATSDSKTGKDVVERDPTRRISDMPLDRAINFPKRQPKAN